MRSINDLTMGASKPHLPAFELVEFDPYPGNWVLAFGGAYSYLDSVETDNDLTTTLSQILIRIRIWHEIAVGHLLIKKPILMV